MTPTKASAPQADALQKIVTLCTALETNRKMTDYWRPAIASIRHVAERGIEAASAQVREVGPSGDDELPGMWERADLIGGATDCKPAAEPVPLPDHDEACNEACGDGCPNKPAAEPVPVAQACGHPLSLLLKSAETGLPLYCELCDALSRARDGEAMEAHWRAKAEALEASLAAYRADAERWRFLRRGYVGADFAWNSPPIPVLIFEFHGRVSADADATLDAAIALRQEAP